MSGSLFEPDGAQRAGAESGGERWWPTELARGPWSPDALHGGPVAALVARAAERCDPTPAMHVARVTLELLRPVPVAPLSVHSELVRPGQKVQEVSVSVAAAGRPVARAQVVRIRVLEVAPGDQPAGPGPASPPGPVPAAAPRGAPIPADYPAFHNGGAELRFDHGQATEPGTASVWVRLAVPVVADEVPSPLQRVVAAADFGNGVSGALPFQRYRFVNPDLTVYLVRPPAGEWIRLEARTDLGPPGTGLSQCVLHDEEGPIGRSLQSLVIEPRGGTAAEG